MSEASAALHLTLKAAECCVAVLEIDCGRITWFELNTGPICSDRPELPQVLSYCSPQAPVERSPSYRRYLPCRSFPLRSRFPLAKFPRTAPCFANTKGSQRSSMHRSKQQLRVRLVLKPLKRRRPAPPCSLITSSTRPYS